MVPLTGDFIIYTYKYFIPCLDASQEKAKAFHKEVIMQSQQGLVTRPSDG